MRTRDHIINVRPGPVVLVPKSYRAPSAKALRELTCLRDHQAPDSPLWHHADIWLKALSGYHRDPCEHRYRAIMGCAARFEAYRAKLQGE